MNGRQGSRKKGPRLYYPDQNVRKNHVTNIIITEHLRTDTICRTLRGTLETHRYQNLGPLLVIKSNSNEITC